ncbi:MULTISPECIES: HipA N-terminal domain-containing protein [Prevotella]|uniref:HipA N-terminal domain-containing protein n=1 Tax=Prevotella TaxID=838 RepID=UPI00272AF143|nr:HipA N-terminal domain-containing protein [Prevotella brunnea]
MLTEYGGEYHFCYDESYLNRKDAMPVSLTLPLQTEKIVNSVLFPFFDGLIPKGWLLDVALRNLIFAVIPFISPSFSVSLLHHATRPFI